MRGRVDGRLTTSGYGSNLGKRGFLLLISFRILYVLLVLRHERRQVVHFNVTENPTAQWTAQQMVEAFPFDTAPRYLLRDRDFSANGFCAV